MKLITASLFVLTCTIISCSGQVDIGGIVEGSGGDSSGIVEGSGGDDSSAGASSGGEGSGGEGSGGEGSGGEGSGGEGSGGEGLGGEGLGGEGSGGEGSGGEGSGGEGSGGEGSGEGKFPLSQHPGCQSTGANQVSYDTQDELAELLVGRWRTCIGSEERGYGFGGEEAGVEFTSDGNWYALSVIDGEIVRNGSTGTWSLESSDTFLIDALQTNPPTITENPKSAVFGVDPRFPRYAPLEE